MTWLVTHFKLMTNCLSRHHNLLEHKMSQFEHEHANYKAKPLSSATKQSLKGFALSLSCSSAGLLSSSTHRKWLEHAPNSRKQVQNTDISIQAVSEHGSAKMNNTGSPIKIVGVVSLCLLAFTIPPTSAHRVEAFECLLVLQQSVSMSLVY